MLSASGNLFIHTFPKENNNWHIVKSFTSVHDDDNPIRRKPFEFSPYNAKGWRLKPSIMHRYLTHQPRRKHAYQLMFALTVWYGGAPSGVLTISVLCTVEFHWVIEWNLEFDPFCVNQDHSMGFFSSTMEAVWTVFARAVKKIIVTLLVIANNIITNFNILPRPFCAHLSG